MKIIKKILFLIISFTILFFMNVNVEAVYNQEYFQVVIEQKEGQEDPTSIDSATFVVVFDESIDASTFTVDDIIISGTTGSITSGLISLSSDNTIFEFTVTGMTHNDTVVASMYAYSVQDITRTKYNLDSVTGGEESKIKNSPIFQDITDEQPYHWESFYIGSDLYIAVANYRTDSTHNVNSKIYKLNGTQFIEIQSIPTHAAYDWESFTIGSDKYLVVANYYNDTTRNIDSKIYKWNGTQFAEIQSIPTQGAVDWESFTINTDKYLVVANTDNDTTRNIDSKIYKWNGTQFAEIQSIPTQGAVDWESFVINSDVYLAVINYSDGVTLSQNSKIYKWNGTQFVEIQSIPTEGAFDWEYFTINSDVYLALANHRKNSGHSYNTNSKIYKWNGTQFVEIQSIPTEGAFNWESFSVGVHKYLAIANYSNDITTKVYSKIYEWDGTQFVEIQSILGDGILDWKFLIINSDPYLVMIHDHDESNNKYSSKNYEFQVDNRVTYRIPSSSGEEKKGGTSKKKHNSSVYGFVWDDNNKNKKIDKKEKKISNVIVKLYKNNSIYKIEKTSDEGEYNFDGLQPGKYKVVIVIPDEYKKQTQINNTIDLEIKSRVSENVNFGIYKEIKKIEKKQKIKESIETKEFCMIDKTYEFSCNYFTQWMHKGDQDGKLSYYPQESGKREIITEVKKLQNWLNTYYGTGIEINGVYDQDTFKAVSYYQGIKENYEYIIKPWSPPLNKNTTGNWYKTSRYFGNWLMGCQESGKVLEDNGKYYNPSSILKNIKTFSTEKVNICIEKSDNYTGGSTTTQNTQELIKELKRKIFELKKRIAEILNERKNQS